MRKSALEPTPASGDPVTILDMQEPARDPNLPQNEKTDLLEVEESPVGESGGDYEDSPYPDVRACVPPTDEDLPCNTFRAWFLGVFWTLVVCGLNQFFQLHNPPLSLSAYLVILLALPCGRILARILPTTQWSILGWTFTLNPGPFNRKEHTIIAIMAVGVTSFDNGSVATDVWTGMEKYLDIPLSTGYKLLFLLTSQALSFGLAGMFQKILVDPAYCVWPAALPTCALLYGMHDKIFRNEPANGWKIHRMKFFWTALIGATAYQFLPGYIFTGLSTFAWITWISPNNVPLNQVFGATSGMDLLPMTLDWNQITGYLSSPLMFPAWAIVNSLFGSILFLWIISPALHWSNVWYGLYTPFSSSGTFDNTGESYNISRIMNADYSLNETAYHSYSPVILSTTSVVSYGLGFASISSILVHTILNHRIEVWDGLKAIFHRDNSKLEVEDIHTQLMKPYKKTPLWWYALSFIIIFALTIFFVEYYDTGLPWWGVILSLSITLIVFLPIGIMTALCNISASTNIISALIGGFIWPGKMIAVVIFKILTFNTLATALVLVRDMKVGHYMKIPPRVVFAAQAVGILVSWLVQTGVNIWALGNVKGICTSEAPGEFICPIGGVYETSIIFWGLIGPKKLFSSGALYNSMLYFFLIGAILPILVFFAARRWPKSFLRKVHIPLIMASTAAIPPATAGNYIPWAIIGLVFNYWIRKIYRPWWSKYNYLLSAALDAGLAITTFFIFFCLYYPGVNFNWYGNTIGGVTADALGTPLKTVAEGTHFGPDSWL